MACRNVFNQFTAMLRKTININRTSRPLCVCQLPDIKKFNQQVVTQTSLTLAKPYTQPKITQWIQSANFYSSDAKQDVSARVLECICNFDKLGAKASEIKLESQFKEDLLMDSLDHVEMIMSIEDEFGVEIPDAELENMDTPSKIVHYLINKADLPVV